MKLEFEYGDFGGPSWPLYRSVWLASVLLESGQEGWFNRYIQMDSYGRGTVVFQLPRGTLSCLSSCQPTQPTSESNQLHFPCTPLFTAFSLFSSMWLDRHLWQGSQDQRRASYKLNYYTSHPMSQHEGKREYTCLRKVHKVNVKSQSRQSSQTSFSMRVLDTLGDGSLFDLRNVRRLDPYVLCMYNGTSRECFQGCQKLKTQLLTQSISHWLCIYLYVLHCYCASPPVDGLSQGCFVWWFIYLHSAGWFLGDFPFRHWMKAR